MITSELLGCIYLRQLQQFPTLFNLALLSLSLKTSMLIIWILCYSWYICLCNVQYSKYVWKSFLCSAIPFLRVALSSRQQSQKVIQNDLVTWSQFTTFPGENNTIADNIFWFLPSPGHAGKGQSCRKCCINKALHILNTGLGVWFSSLSCLQHRLAMIHTQRLL